MNGLHRVRRYPLCMVGVHIAPPPRVPHGPVVADCPCCGKTCYFYGMAAYGLGGPPRLLPAPIRVIAALPAQ